MEGFLESTSAPEAAALVALHFSSFRTPDNLSMQQHKLVMLCNISRVLLVQWNYSGVSDDNILDTEVEECSTVDELKRHENINFY